MKLVDVAMSMKLDGGQTVRVGGLNFGLARLPYVFTDGVSGTIEVVQLDAYGLPLGRFAHLRLLFDYATKVVAIPLDGEEVTTGPIGPPDSFPDELAIAVGAIPSGEHGEVDVRVDDLRITTPP